ncbi:MAG TPA: ABC transporter substrate-binding protein [Symbiobacteriaceae bacterium]|nr:ABC transporter substrate-binding protein [Symbiobacteriaceae bacterium]
MYLSKKITVAVATLALAASVLTACGPKAQPNQPAPGAGGTTAQTPGKPAVGGTVTLRLAKDPDSMNPILSASAYGSMVYGQVYASLFEFNEKFEPEPYVADTWTYTDNNTTLTIKVKSGIKFHDGSDLTADDVVYTISAVMDKDYAGPRSSNVAPIKEITATDKTTVVIKLKEPSASLLEDINFGILQKSAFASTSIKELDKHPQNFAPIGAGPYKFKEYKRGEYVTLERNENWFMSQKYAGAPFVKTLHMKVIPEDATAQASLENGEIDALTPDPKDVTRLEKDFANKLTVYNYERNGWGYMSLNVTRPHLNDKLVRQALTYALDRNAIITGLMDGRAVIPAGPIPSVSWAFDPSIKPFAYDVAKAKQLIEQAGYKLNAQGIAEKNGQPLKLTFYGSSGSSLIEGIAALAKKNWKDIGVDLDIQLMDFNALTENYMKPGKFDVSFSGFSLGLDPDQTALFHSSSVNGFNRMRYSNPQVDKLLEQGVREGDQAKRKAIYSEYQKLLVDDAPVIFVYANLYSDAVAKKIQGVVNFPGAGTIESGYQYRWSVTAQ